MALLDRTGPRRQGISRPNTTGLAKRTRSAIVVLAATAALGIALVPGQAAAQTGVALPAPTLVGSPDDYSTDSTPTWTFTGEPGARFDCTLTQPYEGMWTQGDQPPPEPVIIDSRACDSGSYSFDLGPQRDGRYVLSVTQTDASGSTSEPASDVFRLDRFAYTPLIQTTPDDVTNDPTPIWTYYILEIGTLYGESATHPHCKLTRAGATAAVYDGGCGSERFTFDLRSYPDDIYTLSLTQTDLAGNTSEAATDSFVLDRTTPNAAPVASFVPTCRDVDHSCNFDASASTDSDGEIVSYWWDFGDGLFGLQSGSFPSIWHPFPAPGTYTVKLTVTDNAEGADTDSQTVTVGKPPPPPNAPPSAAFTASCGGLSCSVDAGASSDDGAITSYMWNFGDGTTGSGKTTQHTYSTAAASYTIKLTVTDDDGATDTANRQVAPLTGLTARGTKQKGVQKVELSWNGASGTGYDVYRDGQRIVAGISGTAYTDNPTRNRLGSYAYKVCRTGTSTCTNQATVSF
jgi:PKD repeat protein